MENFLTEFDSKLFDSLSKSANNIFFYYGDMKRNIARWSDSAVEYFGLPSAVLSPASIWDTKIHPDDMHVYQESMYKILNGETPYHDCEYRITNAAGEYVWVNCRGYMTYDTGGNPEFFSGFVQNMGKVIKVDRLTGLWTLYGFRNDITKLLENKIEGAAIYFDIRDFKRINAKYGYDFGDRVLCAVGQKLVELCGKSNHVYRIDGKQFAVLLRGTREDVVLLKNKVDNEFKDVAISGNVLHLDFACAATMFPEDGTFFDNIHDNLTYALSSAKLTAAKGVVFYNEELFEERNKIARMSEVIIGCVENNFEGFRIVMQPIIDSRTGKLHSAEALLRWSNDEFPRVGPMDFVPILEQTENIIPVGRWVIDQAFKHIAEWNSKNTKNKLRHVNINFSYVQFSDSTLKDYIIEELDKYNLPHDTLIAELTESCRVEYSDKLAEILQSFREEGILIALDDFGTGYASLMLLKDTPTDIVKLDHTMTKTIKDRPKDRSLVEFIIKYCNEMSIDVCTEGVENADILNIVRDAGTEYLQGYYFDKPLEADDFFEKYINS